MSRCGNALEPYAEVGPARDGGRTPGGRPRDPEEGRGSRAPRPRFPPPPLWPNGASGPWSSEGPPRREEPLLSVVSFSYVHKSYVRTLVGGEESRPGELTAERRRRERLPRASDSPAGSPPGSDGATGGAGGPESPESPGRSDGSSSGIQSDCAAPVPSPRCQKTARAKWAFLFGPEDDRAFPVAPNAVSTTAPPSVGPDRRVRHVEVEASDRHFPRTAVVGRTLRYWETDLDAVPLRCYRETDLDQPPDDDSAFGSLCQGGGPARRHGEEEEEGLEEEASSSWSRPGPIVSPRERRFPARTSERISDALRPARPAEDTFGCRGTSRHPPAPSDSVESDATRAPSSERLSGGSPPERRRVPVAGRAPRRRGGVWAEDAGVPGRSPERDSDHSRFSRRRHFQCNPSVFSSEDGLHTLTGTPALLNADGHLHGPGRRGAEEVLLGIGGQPVRVLRRGRGGRRRGRSGGGGGGSAGSPRNGALQERLPGAQSARRPRRKKNAQRQAGLEELLRHLEGPHPLPAKGRAPRRQAADGRGPEERRVHPSLVGHPSVRLQQTRQRLLLAHRRLEALPLPGAHGRADALVDRSHQHGGGDAVGAAPAAAVGIGGGVRLPPQVGRAGAVGRTGAVGRRQQTLSGGAGPLARGPFASRGVGTGPIGFPTSGRQSQGATGQGPAPAL
ncbi:uncharacterized protein LOC144211895 isoform X2 [Stigmatopora nigra]